MKKIGILFGQEQTFPPALVERINEKNVKGVQAELLQLGEVRQAVPSDYAVIIDRISQDVPYYRAFLKNAAIGGAAVINNPFWWSADEKFFNNALAETIGIPVPKTVILPSRERPADTSGESFRNLTFPYDWESAIEYLGGFPLYMKPHSGGGWKSVYKVNSYEELFAAYAETGQLVMMLQENINFESYFRCYCIGQERVKIMHYEPRNPHHLRYAAEHEVSDEMLETIEKYVYQLNYALGYDFNTVEFAIRDGVPYAIDFCNPAPDAEASSVGEENFQWVIEAAANMAIERAQAHKEGKMNLTWGTFVKDAVDNGKVKAPKVKKKRSAKVSKPKPAAEPAKKDASALLGKIGQAEGFDDLKAIKGIGPKLEQTLHTMGIQTYKQLSQMTNHEYDMLDDLLDSFKGRAKRDNWAEQAKNLR